MKKLPKSVTIFGRKIPIKMISRKELDQLYPGAGALYDSEKRLILIDKDAPNTIQWTYLFHEIQHAMHSVVGLDQFIPSEILEILAQSGASLTEDILKQLK